MPAHVRSWRPYQATQNAIEQKWKAIHDLLPPQYVLDTKHFFHKFLFTYNAVLIFSYTFLGTLLFFGPPPRGEIPSSSTSLFVFHSLFWSTTALEFSYFSITKSHYSILPLPYIAMSPCSIDVLHIWHMHSACWYRDSTAGKIMIKLTVTTNSDKATQVQLNIFISRVLPKTRILCCYHARSISNSSSTRSNAYSFISVHILSFRVVFVTLFPNLFLMIQCKLFRTRFLDHEPSLQVEV